MLFKYHLILISFLFFGENVNAQKISDSLRAHHYFKLFQDHEYSDTLKARVFSDSALIFANRSKDPYVIARANQFKGWYFQNSSSFTRAKECFTKSLADFIKSGNKQGIADAYGNLGNICFDMKDYVQSLDYQLKSVRENDAILSSVINEGEQAWAQEGKTFALSNIAAIFAGLDLFDKALEYEYRSLEGEIEAGNKVGEAISYCAIAMTYKSLNKVDSAEYYFKKGIKIYKEEKHTSDLPRAYYSYASMKGTTLTKAERGRMLQEALRIDERSGDRDGIVYGLLGIADYQFKILTKDSLGALLAKANELIIEFDLIHHLERFNKISSKYSARFGDFEGAYAFLQEYIRLRKVSDNQKKNREILTAEVKYEVQLKSHKDSLLLAESYSLKREKDQRKIAEQRTWISLGVLGGLVLIGSLSFYIYANRRKQRMNNFLSEKNAVINNQKDIVVDKNRSISASIAYAQRLQSAILPKRSEIEGVFHESFLIFKPKDIVSGDFYWFETYGKTIYIAAADCTGHGVPGAMVSVVCSNALSRVLKEFGITEPAKILSRTRELVMETFGRSDEQVEDGMDISLCAIDKTSGSVIFAGANNPLWIVRNNELLNESSEADKLLNGTTHHLIEFKGDKQPIGPYPKMEDFTDRTIRIFEGDTLYLFSDGFADQFGGEKGKKFMTARLKKELLKRCNVELRTQEIEIDELFENWKGDQEQVDDVCMIAVKL
ncbi:MAG: SpoIIE family protein phosphatase [Flavobacteriales bacterium]|nr:SpoIIE family protein phosphatase [Flavobacteriales bacterium]